MCGSTNTVAAAAAAAAAAASASALTAYAIGDNNIRTKLKFTLPSLRSGIRNSL